ncbi:MAG: arsenic efflux protein [Bacteroidales bacterium]|nr:arsenic efflux protein [Bacteroidales bacterium]
MDFSLILSILFEALKGAFVITALVIVMMALIEYLNIENKGKWFSSIKQSPIRQTIAGTLLGAIPGCVGGFASVSLYTHSIIGAGALISTMIVSTGDEAFVLLATSPGLFFKTLAILCAIALCVGLAISLIKKKNQKSLCGESFQIHQEDKARKKERSFRHFLKEHVWEHIVKKHLLSVFLWSFGALILCGFLTEYINIEDWITGHEGYMPLVVLAAGIIGLIPQSGPHMVFILLVAQGTLPFYVLLASAISQQGHVSLPLLAQSKKSWIMSKAFCALLGIAAGMLGFLLS